MPTLTSDFRYALRALRSSPAFTLVALASLTLGIGANTTIFSVANGLLFSELAVPHPEQLARVVRGSHSPPDYSDVKYIRDHATTIAAVIGERLTSGTLVADGGNAERFDGAFVTGEYFSGLGLRPAIGRFFAESDDRLTAAEPSLVLSYDFWQNRFGSDASVVGRRVRLNDRLFTIVGVAPRGYTSSVFGWKPSAWMPLSSYEAFTTQPLADWNGSVYTTARLKPGVGREQAAAELDALAAQLRQSDSARYARFNLRVLPARGIEEEARQVITVISGAMLALVSIVLLMACANVGNLLLARATGRRREIAVRLALGASRRQLVQQLLVESFLLAVAGTVLGVVGAVAVTKVAVRFVPADLPVGFSFAPDARVLLFAGVLCLLTTVVFGLLPALRASRPDLVDSLKDDVGLKGLRRSRLRSSLLVTQVTMGLVLIAAASLFVRSLGRARTMDPGFDDRGVVNLRVDLRSRHYDPERTLAVFSALLAGARAVPGVESATLASVVLLEGSNTETRARVGGAPAESRGQGVSLDAVWSNYFRTLSIPIISGRPISEVDVRSKLPVAVISAAMARHFWPNESAVGKTFRLGSDSTQRFEVIGVARDVKYYMIGDDARDLVFLPISLSVQGDLALQVRTTAPTPAIARELEGLARRLEPTLPPAKAKAMHDDMFVAYLPSRIGAIVFGSFGVLALLIAMVGIYGVTAYIVAQRTREFGVRAALGARGRDLIGVGVHDTVRLVGIGVAIGLPASYGVARALTALPILYDARAGDPTVLGGATLALLAVATLASYFPARRAAAVDPLVAMRAS